MSANYDDGAALRALLDKQEIAELVRMERFWRDRGDWDRLAAAYVEDAVIRTTWFEGTPREFAEASKTLADAGRHSTHLITPTSIRLRGDRALSESLGEIHHREVLDGVEVDMIQYCRFFSRVQRTDEGWRLASFDGIYGKDLITPVNPADSLPFDWAELEGLRPSYRVWAFTLRRRGYEVSQEIPADDRPDLLEPFYRAAEEWLEGRTTASAPDDGESAVAPAQPD
jgi:hypothetical protein